MLACGSNLTTTLIFKSNQTEFLTTTLIGICNPAPDDTKNITPEKAHSIEVHPDSNRSI